MLTPPPIPSTTDLSCALTDWVIDWVKVLRPTRHKIGHFKHVLQIPQANLLVGMEKLNLTQQKHAFTNQNNWVHNNTK